MSRFSRATKRVSTLLAIIIVAIVTMGAADNATRYNDLGHKMMCACGCGQILIECNHLGCPDSDRMLGELRTSISKGMGDESILAAFQQEYGPTILAAPMLTKFNIVAWVVPPTLLLIGIAGTVTLVRRWRTRAAARPAVVRSEQFQSMRERIRRETDDLGKDSSSISSGRELHGNVNNEMEMTEARRSTFKYGKEGREL